MKFTFPLYALGYLVLRYSIDLICDGIPGYLSYLADTLFGISSLYVNRKKNSWLFSSHLLIKPATLSIISGIAVLHLLSWCKITIPYNFNLSLLPVFLVIGPISEELFFREGIWHGLRAVFSSRTTILIAAASFSLFHLTAVVSTSQVLHPFIFIQSIYVFLISLIWGYVRSTSNTFLTAMICHMLFNLAFFTAGYILSA